MSYNENYVMCLNSSHAHSLNHMLIQQIVINITFGLGTVYLQSKNSQFKISGRSQSSSELGQLQKQLSCTAVCGTGVAEGQCARGYPVCSRLIRLGHL